MRLGEQFIHHQIADEEQIKKALEIQAATGGKIGEILLAMENMRAVDYYKIIAKHYQITFVDLLKEKIDLALLISEDKEKYFSEMTIPINRVDGHYVVATADPGASTFARIREEYGENAIITCTSKFDILWTLQYQFNTDYLESSIYDLSKKSARLSAKYRIPLWLRFIYCLPLLALIGLFFVNPKFALLLTNCIILVGLSFTIIFKVVLSIIGLFILEGRKTDYIDLNQDDLPIYSILVPLYKENQITINNLFLHLKKIIYPKHKLDIKVLLEEDDIETIKIIKKLHLPSHIEFIYVPAGEPRTKAKACNYGFKFVRGEFVCLYDAEDNPDPDQLVRVIQFFKKSENTHIGCVQCKLGFYNSNENWLTRMFSLEYSYWFDLLLPALSATRIPLPLGGTSNHFRTKLLREVVAWDPFNVTEDADLGLRLSRLGYETKILDSMTYEEANCRLWNWIRQRTRWIKGYMQTYLVHMRNPFELWYKVGTKGFLGIQLFVGGTVLSNLSNLPMWIVTITLLLLPQIDASYYFPPRVHEMAIINLYAGTLGVVFLNVLALIARRRPKMVLFALTSPVYWLLMSIASYRALYQLMIRPNYWDKTLHGISSVFSVLKKTTQDNINMQQMSDESGIKFGTSGLRAYNDKLTDKLCYGYTTAFLQYLESTNKISPDDTVMIAGDYRKNTSHIVSIVAKAISDKGYMMEYFGKIPTPALANYSIAKKSPSIMVTGSHIPDDMNGIKFYTSEGEITKQDEQGILSQTFNLDSDIFDPEGFLFNNHLYLVPISFEAINVYLNRYLNFLPSNALQGLNIGVYKHSSVGAESLITLLTKLGANVFAFGESKQFHSVDTEALSLSDKQIVKHHLQLNNLNAVVSTDGDADRPLITDENGEWIHGDIIGMLCALILEAKYVVTPISSNSSVDSITQFQQVIRTKIGSPYVIEKMQELRNANKTDIIGYEANGGVLIGNDITRNQKTLSALPTRDSMIAILVILAYANKNKIKLSELVRQYSHSYTESSSLKLTSEKIQSLFTLLTCNNQMADSIQKFFKLDETIAKVDLTDGIRAALQDNKILHLRASGNSPELRCYTEAADHEAAKKLNQYCMDIVYEWSNEC